MTASKNRNDHLLDDSFLSDDDFGEFSAEFAVERPELINLRMEKFLRERVVKK